MRALAVFARAPVRGAVKRRLAGEVGAATAADVYRRIGRQVIDAVAGSGYQTTVWFTPATERRLVQDWLGDAGRLDFRPQSSGPLGTRLRHTFARHFAQGGGPIIVIGTDCPGIDRRLILDAFGNLATRDVVLGPALDGGYYLVGLKRPRPELFRGISWSTPAVLAQTRARARALGLAVGLLQPLRDVDTARDAHLLGLLKS